MNIVIIFTNCSEDAPSFPLGVGIISSILKEHHHNVLGIYVQHLSEMDSIISRVESFNPELIAFSSTTPAFGDVKAIAEKVKDLFSVPTICGGVHPTIYPKDALKAKGIDFIAVGEGEKNFIQFVEALRRNTDPLSIPGIWGLSKSGKLIKNKLFPLQPLNKSPRIDYEAFGLPFIKQLIKQNNGWLRFITSRGCPYNCTYCHNKLIKQTYKENIGCSENNIGYLRFKDIDLCIDEIESIVNKYDVKVINLMDDLFGINKKLTINFCNLFKSNLPEDVYYSVQTHLNFLDDEILTNLKKSRCLRVVVGVESGSERILAIFKRRFKNEEMSKALKKLVSTDFPKGTWTLNILGNPTETYKEMLQTIEINSKNLVDVCKFNLLAPYPGSEIYDYCLEKKLFKGKDTCNSFSSRYQTSLIFNPKEEAFLEKFFDIGHWYFNLLAPLGLEKLFQPLIEEVEKVPFGKWQGEIKKNFLEMDKKIQEKLYQQKVQFYTFGLRGKITGQAISLVKY